MSIINELCNMPFCVQCSHMKHNNNDISHMQGLMGKGNLFSNALLLFLCKKNYNGIMMKLQTDEKINW